MWLILLFQDSLHRQAVKPSFVAPSQPLEKSLKEHIQKTAGLADWETGGETRGKEETKAGKKAGHKRDKKKKATMAAAPTSKESSPSDSRKSTSSK